MVERTVVLPREEILRRSAFFSPDLGLIYRGTPIYGIAPIGELIDHAKILPEIIKHQEDESVARNLLSRTFVFYDHSPQQVKSTLLKLENSVCTARIICSEDSKQLIETSKTITYRLMKPGSLLVADTLFLVYAGTLSGKKLNVMRSYLSVKAPVVQSLVSEISRQTSNTKFTKSTGTAQENLFYVAKFSPTEKPFSQLFLDTALYMEKSELLTPKERRLRIIFTLLLFPTIVIPVAALILYHWRMKETKYTESNLTRWQFSNCAKKQENMSKISQVVFSDSVEMEPLRNIVDSILQMYMLKDQDSNTLEAGKVVSMRHALLFASRPSLLTKKQIMLQWALIASAAMVFLGGVASFTMFTASMTSDKAFYPLLLSCTGLALATGVMFASKGKTKTILSSIGCAVLLFVPIVWGVKILKHNAQPTLPDYGKAASVALVLAVCVFAIAIFVENLVLHVKEDKAVAEKLDLSISSYLEVKPTLVEALEKYSNENKSVNSCLKALKDGGCDISPFFERTNEDVAVAPLKIENCIPNITPGRAVI